MIGYAGYLSDSFLHHPPNSQKQQQDRTEPWLKINKNGSEKIVSTNCRIHEGVSKIRSVMRYYDSHVDSLGKKKARIATMNKILDIIFAVLKRGTPYVYR